MEYEMTDLKMEAEEMEKLAWKGSISGTPKCTIKDTLSTLLIPEHSLGRKVDCGTVKCQVEVFLLHSEIPTSDMPEDVTIRLKLTYYAFICQVPNQHLLGRILSIRHYQQYSHLVCYVH